MPQGNPARIPKVRVAIAVILYLATLSSCAFHIYSAFGELLGIQDAQANDVTANPPVNTSYGFTGRERDSESGLMYYRARMYDPNTGRFLQQDPAPGQFNLPITVVNKYAYAQNSPLMYLDPTGRFSFLEGLIIGVVAAVAVVAAPELLGFALSSGLLGVLEAGAIGAVAGGLTGGFIGLADKGSWVGFRNGFESGAITGGESGLVSGAVTQFAPFLSGPALSSETGLNPLASFALSSAIKSQASGLIFNQSLSIKKSEGSGLSGYLSELINAAAGFNSPVPQS